MNRVKEILRSQRGMALLLVLCLFAMLTAFGASLIFAANASAGGAVRNFEQEQARLSAQSFCELVRSELIKPGVSNLKTKAGAVGNQAAMIITADLPEGMGSVTSQLYRATETEVTLTATATVGKSSCTLRLLLSRSPGNPPVWQSSGYIPVIP